MMIKIKKLHPDAVIPRYMTPGASSFDLFAVDSGSLHATDYNATVYRTGIAVEIPAGHAMFILSRSGHGFKRGIRLSNCVGDVDSDYRGEVMVSLRDDSGRAQMPVAGDRIAQAFIIPVPKINFIEVDDLSETERGTNGFGSTGDDGAIIGEPYRPYSGIEGEAFKAGHCYQCKRFESGCDIELRTMAHSENDPEYPREWVRTDDGPTCTAFDGIDDEVKP